MNNYNTKTKILILEDDIDQMRMLIDFTQNKIKEIQAYASISFRQKRMLEDLQLIKISNIASLQTAVSVHKDIFFTILDCNTPDTKGGEPNDQLVTTNHIVTGQHRAADLVIKHLPDAQITMISSLNRFQRTINRYYASNHNLSINFVQKSDPLEIQKNIEQNLRVHLESVG